jgi:hypothetical protein
MDSTKCYSIDLKPHYGYNDGTEKPLIPKGMPTNGALCCQGSYMSPGLDQWREHAVIQRCFHFYFHYLPDNFHISAF